MLKIAGIAPSYFGKTCRTAADIACLAIELGAKNAISQWFPFGTALASAKAE